MTTLCVLSQPPLGPFKEKNVKGKRIQRVTIIKSGHVKGLLMGVGHYHSPSIIRISLNGQTFNYKSWSLELSPRRTGTETRIEGLDFETEGMGYTLFPETLEVCRNDEIEIELEADDEKMRASVNTRDQIRLIVLGEECHQNDPDLLPGALFPGAGGETAIVQLPTESFFQRPEAQLTLLAFLLVIFWGTKHGGE